MEIIPIPAFRDNYLWLLRTGSRAAVVDPGDAAPVLAYLRDNHLELSAILLTHHHADHIGGLDELLQHYRVPVFGPAHENINGITHKLCEGDQITVPGIGVDFEVFDVPGHTSGHIAYYGAKALFCGDTMFACGCGRLFEGTPQQMAASLAKLAALPPETRVYCAHEYTQANIVFALAVEPDNEDLQERAVFAAETRAAGLPTVPSTIALELATNPFLRGTSPSVIAAAQRYRQAPLKGPVEVFAAIREWKNNF